MPTKDSFAKLGFNPDLPIEEYSADPIPLADLQAAQAATTYQEPAAVTLKLKDGFLRGMSDLQVEPILLQVAWMVNEEDAYRDPYRYADWYIRGHVLRPNGARFGVIHIYYNSPTDLSDGPMVAAMMDIQLELELGVPPTFVMPA